MNHATEWLVPPLVLLTALLAGCPNNDPPAPADGLPGEEPSEIISVSPKDPEEYAAVEAVALAKARYAFQLEALIDHVKASGDIRKQHWAERELKCLGESQTVHWQGFGRVEMTEPATLAGANEPMLVELLADARKQYVQAANAL